MPEIKIGTESWTAMTIDEEEFEIIKLVVQEEGGHKSLAGIQKAIQKVEALKPDWEKSRLQTLCLLARCEITGGAVRH